MKKMNHKCVLTQPQALAVHASCEALASLDTWAWWYFYTENAGEPDSVVALSPEVNAA